MVNIISRLDLQIEKLKNVAASFASMFTGAVSFLGGYQVCHNICIGIIALLSIIGITVTGMPLLFLTKVAVPFWIAAVVLLIISILIYIKKQCISRELIILNTGLIIAGVPFNQFQKYTTQLLVIGGVFILVGIALFVMKKFNGVEKWKRKM